MCSPKAPEPTPPRETSAAATGTNVATSIANAFLTNMNEVTPDGTKTFNQSGDYTFTDPYTKQTYTVPRFTMTQTLSPQQQAIKAQSDATKMNLSTLAKDQSGFLNDYMEKPFQYDPGEHEGWALGLYDKLNADKTAQSDEALRSRLAAQGIKAGSEAYDREMQNAYAARADARDKFLLDSYRTGFSTAQAERNQPLNEIAALMSGSQVSQPNFVTGAGVSGIPITDNGAIIANSDAQRMQAWQQSQAAMGGLFGGMGGLFEGLGAAGLKLSDERAKADKEKVGETEDGLGIFSYRYKGSPKTELGLIAQDVVKKRPSAVKKLPGGLMAVDYKKALA